MVLFYTNIIPNIYDQKRHLVEILDSMKMGSTALDLLLMLHMYEDAALVYAKRGQETKATNLLLEKLENSDKHESELLSDTTKINYYCALGDINLKPEYYQKALEMAETDKILPRSRILKSFGYLYYRHPTLKDNTKAAYYFQEALKISPLDNNVWFCLGCIGLATNQPEISAEAFRRSTLLNWDNFQAWGNLAAAYCKIAENTKKLENKIRAFRALQEALKCEYSNKKLWENFLNISVDIGELKETIRGYHRLLDINTKYTDLKVLAILVENYDKIPGLKIEKSEVRKLLKRVLDSDVSNYQAWEMLGWLVGLDEDKNDSEDIVFSIDCYWVWVFENELTKVREK